jgi:hypothetical protein
VSTEDNNTTMVLGSEQVVAFVPTTDLDRAREFHGSVLGTTPGGDEVAWFKDPDGNTLSVTQFVADTTP